MKSKLLVVSVLTGIVVAVFASAGPDRAAAAATLNVNVGGGANSIAANGFFPKSVTIHAGDTIHFDNPYLEPHTTTFVPSGTTVPPLVVPGPSGLPQLTFSPEASNPTFTGTSATFDATKYFNSGILFKDSAFSVTFPKTGAFKFICLFHNGMELTVNVGASGATADTQAALDARAQSQLTATLAAGEAAAGQVVPAGTETLSSGSSKYHAVAGTESATVGLDADVMRFFPKNITVKTGDTIEWSNTTDIPHTITFGVAPTIPPLATPLAQPSGPPLLVLNPAVFAPAGGNSYNGTGVVNTGAIGEGFVATSASITFTAPGTYTYACLIHADQGMTGTITVTGAAAGAAATPTAPTGIVAPNTGSGPNSVIAGSWSMGSLALALIGASLLVGGTRARRRVD